MNKTHYINLDTETTGLIEPDAIELGIIHYPNFSINIPPDRWLSYTKPDFVQKYKPNKPIEDGAYKVHGIKQSSLRHKPNCKTINLHKILNIPETDKIIVFGSNPIYDIRVLKYPKNVYTIDCKILWKIYFPLEPSYSLHKLIAKYYSDVQHYLSSAYESHSGLGDCQRVHALFTLMLKSSVEQDSLDICGRRNQTKIALYKEIAALKLVL